MTLNTNGMSEILYDHIPSLDLADFTGGDPVKKQKFVNDLGAAYQTIGFVAIRNHYLTDDLSARLYEVIKKFFALPDHVKQKHESRGGAGQRGYVGKGKEHAKGRNTGDLKEFYHVGQEVLDNDPIKKEYPDNIWPEELPEFRDIALDVYRRLEKTGVQILKAIALYLGLPENYFYLPNQFYRHKNHQLVVDALTILKRRGVEVVVCASGSTEDRRDRKSVV